MQNSNQSQNKNCCENEYATCKCKAPMIVGAIVFSLLMLAFGFFLGSAKQNTGASTSTPVVVSPTITEATSGASLEGWKTYTNEKYGFEFKYPDNLELKEKTGGKDKFDKYYLVDVLISSTDYLKITEAKMTTIGRGYSFRIVLSDNICDDSIESEQIAYSGKCIIVTGDYSMNNKSLWLKLFDQILSTFKFTEKSNLKKYTLENVLEFQYPKDWDIFVNDAPLGESIRVQCSNRQNCTSKEGLNIDTLQVLPVIFKSTAEYVKSVQDNNAQFKYEREYKKIQLSNQEAIISAIPAGIQAGGSSLEYFVFYKNQGYKITFQFQGLYDKNKLSDFPTPNPDIISTFKFL